MSFSEHEDATHLPHEESHRTDDLADEPRLLTRREAEAETADADERQLGDSAAATDRRQTTDRPGRSRASARPRRFLITFALLAALAFLCIAALVIWLRHAMRAALPVVDGTLHVAGLHAPVTVTRNAQGVPSIQAANTDDLMFAQGFVTAQDRLWQMDALRRHAAGELAEILGSSLVDHDKRQRYLQLRSAADGAVQHLTPEQLHDLEQYASGVNAFIESHRDRLPIEFHVLHYLPRPWTPRDSMLVSLVMWQDLTTSFPEKLDREALSRHLPAALLADLYPTGSWRDRPPTQPKTDLTTPRDIEEIPLDPTQSKLAQPADRGAAPGDLLAVATAVSRRNCAGCRAGSNNWAVSGAHSASGAPLVSNDMHLALSAPDIWYEAVLHATATGANEQPADVEGFTLPGIPWVVVGRNQHVAWSFTNLGADVQDVRLEHLRGSGSDIEFEQVDGSWTAVRHHAEHIVVRGGHDLTLDVQTVVHPIGTSAIENPIISPMFHSESRALSLDWTIYDPACVAESFSAIDRAADGASLVAALANFGGPALNLVYADDQGHIGYHALGRIPVRGAPVHHPRLTQQFELPTPEPESEEQDDKGAALAPAPQIGAPAGDDAASVIPSVFDRSSADQSYANPRALWRMAAYQPSRRHTHRAPRARSKPEPQQPAPKPAAAPAKPLAAPPIEQNFSIGSAISPVPVDALDQTQLWSGYIPYEELPATQDPASGVLATANARVTPDNYPYAITLDWADAYRVERIYRLLEGRNALTPQAMLAVQNDQHSEFDLALAQRLSYAIDHASNAARGEDAARLRQAADLLRTWRGEMSAGSPAAAIVAAAHAELWPALLVPQIVAHDGASAKDAALLAQLYFWDGETTALENLLQHSRARWLPPGVASWNDLLTTVVERALRQAGAPHDLLRWHYGAHHSIDIEHPLFADRPWVRWLLGAATGSGQQAAGGDTTTVDALGRSFGPSERFTADLSNTEATLANITTGESGSPASPWYLDQFLPWLHGTSFRLPLNDKGGEHTLTLLPSS